MSDWMTDETPQPLLPAQPVNPAQMQQYAQALDRARLFVDAFVTNPSGHKLLEEWRQTALNRRVSPNAPHTEYAWVEAQRTFVHDIEKQIQFAQTGRM